MESIKPEIRGILKESYPQIKELNPAQNAVVDAGFLELVRYGVRRPDDPLIVDSLKVVDAVVVNQRGARVDRSDVLVCDRVEVLYGRHRLVAGIRH